MILSNDQRRARTLARRFTRLALKHSASSYAAAINAQHFPRLFSFTVTTHANLARDYSRWAATEAFAAHPELREVAR